MTVYFSEVAAGLMYLSGYALVTKSAIEHNEHHFGAYALITLAATIHLLIIAFLEKPNSRHSKDLTTKTRSEHVAGDVRGVDDSVNMTK